VFPDVFARSASMLSDDRPLLITGEAEAGDNLVKIRAQEIVALETVRQKSMKAIVIPISQEGLTRSSLIRLRDLISRYPGECRLTFRINLDGDRKATVVAHNRYSIMPGQNLIEQIEGLLGAKVIGEV